MGFESDYDIVSAVGLEEKFVAAMAPSIEECSAHQIVTQESALQFIASKVLVLIYIVSLSSFCNHCHQSIAYINFWGQTSNCLSNGTN
ncbi:unnamed protein product [Anisakis simplex]|uniref:Uncharacterized protein n=1 Tax=Anisakis simplex TaxID=6269 RepID=A0A0M3JLA1_ANISI|nr:unnamed protein product [Anisakis simplex]